MGRCRCVAGAEECCPFWWRALEHLCGCRGTPADLRGLGCHLCIRCPPLVRPGPAEVLTEQIWWYLSLYGLAQLSGRCLWRCGAVEVADADADDAVVGRALGNPKARWKGCHSRAHAEGRWAGPDDRWRGSSPVWWCAGCWSGSGPAPALHSPP